MKYLKVLKITALLGFVGVVSIAQADTISNYMTISNNIPIMTIKPDEQSQAWVRSAQRILTSTNETLAQTVVSMNSVAAKQGHPVFCFQQGVLFDGNAVHEIIEKTYAELTKTQGADVANMSISDVLMIGMVARYSCSALPAATSTASVEPGTPMTSVSASAASLPSTAQQAPATSAAPQPVAALPSQSAQPTAMPPLPTDSMENNPYGTPATQQVVTADSPPTL